MVFPANFFTLQRDFPHVPRGNLLPEARKRDPAAARFVHSACSMSVRRENLRELIDQVAALRQDAHAAEADFASQLERLPAHRKPSARNLIHYLALRRSDLRDLQHRLSLAGLSSLGRAESHVAANLDAVLEVLYALNGTIAPVQDVAPAPVTQDEGQQLIDERTRALFGSAGPAVGSGRSARIMVTLPNESADEAGLLRDLVQQGMDCLRINCAHGGPEDWGRQIAYLERARRETGRPCALLMDLAGPKLRTGAVEAGPRVVSWKPHLDELGQLESPALVWLTPEEGPELAPHDADVVVPVSAAWLDGLSEGTRIRFIDLRHKSRRLRVLRRVGRSCLAEGRSIAFLGAETVLSAGKATASDPLSSGQAPREARLQMLPPLDQFLLLRTGDDVTLTRDATPGKPVRRDASGRIVGVASIPCTLPEVFEDVREGDRIWFDDGKLSGVIIARSADAIRVRILNASPPGKKLRADKGINLPDSALRLPALTAKDLSDLDFVAKHADIVGLSFVKEPSDVQALREALAARIDRKLGLVLKVETRRAFDRLPSLLLAGLEHDALGVMIARGDLAVECGYERLAEVQEEILWLCEAAHVPAIWATQVLETLNKKGLPSRAEITDAAMGERAECVMLNKGPHVLDAVRVLDDILGRMQAHQSKKVSLLRALSVSRRAPLGKPEA